MDDIIAFFSKWTPGGVGIWTLVAMLLIAWWQGLPKLLDAITNRQSKIEERMGKLLEDATLRFERQIKAADDRHAECMEGQRRLQERVQTLEDEVDKLRDENAGLKRQRIQGQVSAIRSAPESVSSPVIEDMVQSLESKGFGG